VKAYLSHIFITSLHSVRRTIALVHSDALWLLLLVIRAVAATTGLDALM
jgi:hypothetical protein